MKQYAFLDYTFIFDPSSTWSHSNQFEKDLENFFAAHGKETQVVNGIAGQMGKKIVLIQRIDPTAVMLDQPKAPDLSQRTPAQILNQMGQKKGFDGKFKGVNKP